MVQDLPEHAGRLPGDGDNGPLDARCRAHLEFGRKHCPDLPPAAPLDPSVPAETLPVDPRRAAALAALAALAARQAAAAALGTRTAAAGDLPRAPVLKSGAGSLLVLLDTVTAETSRADRRPRPGDWGLAAVASHTALPVGDPSAAVPAPAAGAGLPGFGEHNYIGVRDPVADSFYLATSHPVEPLWPWDGAGQCHPATLGAPSAGTRPPAHAPPGWTSVDTARRSRRPRRDTTAAKASTVSLDTDFAADLARPEVLLLPLSCTGVWSPRRRPPPAASETGYLVRATRRPAAFGSARTVGAVHQLCPIVNGSVVGAVLDGIRPEPASGWQPHWRSYSARSPPSSAASSGTVEASRSATSRSSAFPRASASSPQERLHLAIWPPRSQSRLSPPKEAS